MSLSNMPFKHLLLQLLLPVIVDAASSQAHVSQVSGKVNANMFENSTRDHGLEYEGHDYSKSAVNESQQANLAVNRAGDHGAEDKLNDHQKGDTAHGSHPTSQLSRSASRHHVSSVEIGNKGIATEHTDIAIHAHANAGQASLMRHDSGANKHLASQESGSQHAHDAHSTHDSLSDVEDTIKDEELDELESLTLMNHLATKIYFGPPPPPAEDCKWGDWNKEPCSTTCGVGQEEKKRSIKDTAKFGGKPCSPDNDVETVKDICNPGECEGSTTMMITQENGAPHVFVKPITLQVLITLAPLFATVLGSP